MVAGKPSGQAAPNKTGQRAWSKVAAGSPKSASPSRAPVHDKLAAVIAKLTNKRAEVTLKSGLRYAGIVSQVDVANGLSVTLRDVQAVNVANGSKSGAASTLNELVIKPGELVQVHGPNEQPQQQQPAHPSSNTPSSIAWKTDVDISGRSYIKERTLQAWQPDSQDEGFSLESDSTPARGPQSAGAGVGGKWDQFAANEQLFGVKSQWDEDVYTHKLDTSRPDFAKRQAEAAKIAREIEGAASNNPHVLEERNLTVDDSGMTEEDKYSGVARTANRWIPPAQRAAAQAQNSGQPVDPAIISAQLARPSAGGLTPSRATPSSGKDDPIEAKLMRTFQDFVGKEETRIQQKKAQSLKKEKDGRLQDLLKFSQSFKLKTPVPEDLIPILTKDKSKQDAIVQKSASNSSAASSPVAARPVVHLGGKQEAKPETLRAKIDKMRASPGGQLMPSPIRERSPANPAAPSAATPASSTKLKPTAFAFKPSAASFTPSFAPRGSVGVASSPALSNNSTTQPRHPPNYVDPSLFLHDKQPRPFAERENILDHYNPFKSFKEKNPEAPIDIEAPHRTDPAWPNEEDARGLLDPPTYTFGKPHSSGSNVTGSYDEFKGVMPMPMPMQPGMSPYGAPFMQPMMVQGPGMPPQFMGQPMYIGSPQAMAAAAAAAAAGGMPFAGMPQGYYGQQLGVPPMMPQHAGGQQAGSPQQPAGFYGAMPSGASFGGPAGGQGQQQAGGKHGGQGSFAGQSFSGPAGYGGYTQHGPAGGMGGYQGGPPQQQQQQQQPQPQQQKQQQQQQQQQQRGGQSGMTSKTHTAQRSQATGALS
ncbi:hypothetical protein BCR37DRAFT_394440 [Protomyces lactucae-debilis]|uniref:LsmAD domain-containing protein n=1 Tax=Protomyces lactucae-debilis TaxID=2754530 RepID=A0A1Y2F5H4_PROLT|nr:uncharacterized protein BCR37DRAFT_394440 [Protomyces lactucae-debilis]ORY79109.1 hypothetical protein BCR37DRAFT_394440 [Protomyces lactucae-debilis]